MELHLSCTNPSILADACNQGFLVLERWSCFSFQVHPQVERARNERWTSVPLYLATKVRIKCESGVHFNLLAIKTNGWNFDDQIKFSTVLFNLFYTPAQRSWRGGILDSPCPSVRLSVRPSVCRQHGFRSISQVCFGISISNFICMLMVAIGRSLLIFSDVTFKMAAWRPYWIFWFPDSKFTLAFNINFKLQRHNTYVYG